MLTVTCSPPSVNAAFCRRRPALVSAAASGLRNLVAHQYGVLDWRRIHVLASTELIGAMTDSQSLALFFAIFSLAGLYFLARMRT